MKEKAYIVRAGRTSDELAKARAYAAERDLELVVVDSEADLLRKIELTISAPPILAPVLFEPLGGYDNRTSRKNKGRNKKYNY